jgi:predicted transglutaminase-like cysteine proteinase
MILTPEQFKTAEKIFNDVKGMFIYESDEKQFGMEDIWPTTAQLDEELKAGQIIGDCDDFASACHLLLSRAGIPSRLVICLTEDGGGHMVCEAGGWILDNRQDAMVLMAEVPYVWIAATKYDDDKKWYHFPANLVV